MADNSSILSALKGVDPADAMPFGAAATPEGSPTALSSMLSGLFSMPSHLAPPANEAVLYKTASPMVNITDKDIDTAMNVGMGAGPGIFGGKLSPMADLRALQEAERMRGHGIHPDEVIRDTNWFRSPTDNKWKFEIPDNTSKFNPKALPKIEGDSITGRTDLILQHPELYQNYPKLSYATTQITKDPVRSGMFDNGKNYVSAPSIDDARSVLLHETQHGVQTMEGFSPGADPAHYAGLIEKGLKNRPDKFAAYDFDAIRNQANELYHKTAGEVEARNVQARMDWNQIERKAVPPWYSQDVPYRDQLIFDPVADTLNALRRK